MSEMSVDDSLLHSLDSYRLKSMEIINANSIEAFLEEYLVFTDDLNEYLKQKGDFNNYFTSIQQEIRSIQKHHLDLIKWTIIFFFFPILGIWISNRNYKRKIMQIKLKAEINITLINELQERIAIL